MQRYDYPDTLEAFDTMSKEVGFRCMSSIAGTSKGWFHLLVFET